MQGKPVVVFGALLALTGGLIWLLVSVLTGLDRRMLPQMGGPGSETAVGDDDDAGEGLDGPAGDGERTGEGRDAGVSGDGRDDGPLPGSVAGLVAELNTAGVDRRVAICERLGEMGDDGEAVDELASRVLVDSASKVRVAAVRAVARLRPDDLVKRMTGWLDHYDERVRTEVLTGLGRLADAAALAPLLERVRNPKYRPRWLVIDALASMRLPAVASELAKIATDAGQPKQDRLRALAHLGGFDGQPVAKDAIELCRQDADEDIAAVAKALK